MNSRILFVIVHYFNPHGNGSLGSLRNDPPGRANALGNSITSLHDLFNKRTISLDYRSTYLSRPANTDFSYTIEILVLTTQGMTVFDYLSINPDLFEEVPTTADPLKLGFEVNRLFQEQRGHYDWYVYLEDDIILHDPLFFLKLRWFESTVGCQALLQPNRYEVTGRDGRGKVYIDGDLVPDQVTRYRNRSRKPPKIIEAEQWGQTFRFALAPNPHAGCYFLSQAQLDLWIHKPWYGEPDTGFVRSFESAASLGILKTFDIYKPDLECAAFLEVQHFGEAVLAEVIPPAGVLSGQTQRGKAKPAGLQVAELEAQAKYLENELRRYQQTPLMLKNAQLAGEIQRLEEIVRTKTDPIEPATQTKVPIEPHISVIIPLYNGEKYIQQAIDSVISQTWLPLEIIIVNDGSTDQSVAIVEGIKSALDLKLVHQINAGQSAARNHGARLAKGELLAFLDQDDIWYSHHLQRLVTAFQGESRIGWSYSDLDEIDRDGYLITKNYLATLGIVHPKRSLIEFLGQDLFILPSTSLVRKSAFAKLGGFDERLSGCEDDDLFLRLFRAGYDCVFFPEALSQWRIRHDSASYTDRMTRSREIYAKKLMETFPDEPLLARYYGRDCIAPRFYQLALAQYQKFLILEQWETCLNYLQRLRYYDQLLYRSFPGLVKRRLRHALMSYPKFYKKLIQLDSFLFPRRK